MKTFFTFIVALFSCTTFSQTIGLTPFATGFSGPVEITHPIGDTRLFVVQQTGAIRILNPNGAINPTNFLTLTTATISNGSERGLLGMAFHPNYATNGFYYVNYTNTAGNTVIARYSVSANPDVSNTTGTIILTVSQPYSNHNGGSIKFGLDGYLYIGMGDGGNGGDPGNRAQNTNENLGKMLRIDVDSASPYAIPATNPFVGIVGNDEIWAIGMRNPWKFSFNRLNGDLWIADVGQNAIEEINRTVSPLPAGLNYGWKCYEGNVIYDNTGCVPVGSLTMPVAQYTHSGGACSITGGYEYTGSNYPNFIGKYFFADYCNNKIGMLNIATSTYTWTTAFSGTNFSTFGEDLNGELYVAGASNGVIYKVIDTSLGVNSFTKSGFEIYPNPATTAVNIKANNLIFPSFVTISDITGKNLINQSLDSETNVISTASLQSGIYLVSIKDGSGANFSSKLTVK